MVANHPDAGGSDYLAAKINEVARCRLKRVETNVETAWIQRLKL
jgi:hypothetical protein